MQIIDLIRSNSVFYMGPFTQIFNYFRGIKNAMIDIRRRPEKVKAACDAFMEQSSKAYGYLTSSEEIKEKFKDAPILMGMTGINSECFLSPKQLDEYYISYFKKYFTPYFEAGFTFFVGGEGNVKAIAERLADFPKGSICLDLGSDYTEDIAPILQGRQTIIAGIHMNDLRYRTKEECIDIARKNIDKYAGNGGFVFGHNSTLMSGNDAKFENVKAVYDFVVEYGRY